MANNDRRIIASRYTYQTTGEIRNGRPVFRRVGEPKRWKLEKGKTFSNLRSELIEQASGVTGKNVKFKRYENVRVAVKPKIDHFYNRVNDNTYTKTFYRLEPKYKNK